MAYYIFHIPSMTFPTELTKINDSVYCFPSKQINTCTDYEIYSNCLCLVINSGSESNVMKALKDFIIVFNIFRQEVSAIQWFSNLNIKIHKPVNDSIENIYVQYKANERIGLYHDDFNDMPVHLVMPLDLNFSFIEIFNKFIIIPESDFLYKSLSYLAIINPIKMTIDRFYNNALLENALLFQLFESIMGEYDTTEIVTNKPCPTCNHSEQRGINRRIDDFFNSHDYKTINLKPEIIKAIKIIGRTRHKFFHNLEGKSKIEYSQELENKKGKGTTYNLNDDIKYGQGVFQSVHIVKAINTIILIDKLLKKK